MGVSGGSCSSCSKAIVAAEKAAHGLHAGAEDAQPRADLHTKPGGWAAGDLVVKSRGQLEDSYVVERERPLGEGLYSLVYPCTHKATNEVRAVKVIKRKALRSSSQAEEEIRIMRLIDHPNVVHLYESFEDGDSIYLVLEFCAGGELFDYIVDSAPLSERKAAACFRQLLCAVSYLHHNHLVHRDLKAENWLLAGECPPDKATVKLADFGLAKHLGPREFAQTKVGLPHYVAPEVLSGQYDSKADMWSLGIVLYMLLVGMPPFTGNNTQEVLKNVRNNKVPLNRIDKAVSTAGKTLFLAMLDKHPEQRPCASGALNDNWFVQTLKVDPSSAAANFNPRNLKGFGRAGKFEKITLSAIAVHMDRAAIADLEQAFMAMDTNGDGTLSAVELAAGLERSGVKMEQVEVKDLLEQIDMDGSGAIDYTEFVAAAMDQAQYMRNTSCLKAFNAFDTNGDGYIERSELVELLRSDEVRESFPHGFDDGDNMGDNYQRSDTNGDGKIDFDEFMAMLHGLDRTGSSRCLP